MIADEALVRLTEAMATLQDAQKIKTFLNEMLTPMELHDFALRWEVVERLADGETQRSIASNLHVSLCKITRGAKILKDPKGVVTGLVAEKLAETKKRNANNGTRIARKS